MDLLGMIKDQVSGQLAGQASKFLGESESGVSKALDGIFPSLLGSAINMGESESGASKIMDLIGGMDDGGMDNIAGVFSGGASGVSKLMNQGSGILNLLMGNRSGGMIDSIAKFSGLKGSAASSLIKMAAPFLLRMIGKQVMGKGTAGLMSLLSGQKSAVKSALPAGLGSLGLLGSMADGASNVAGGAVDAGKKVVSGAADVAGGAVDAGKKVVSGAANVAGDVGGAAVKTGGSILRWLLPVALGLLLLGFFGFKTGCGAIDNAAEKTAGVTGDVVGGAADMAKKGAGAVGDAAGAVGGAVGDAAGAVGDAAGAVGDVIGGAFSNVNEAAKTALGKISFTAGSAGSQMMEYIEGGFKGNGKFRFSNLTFTTGSAKIDGTTGGEIDNVAAILKAYPDVKVSVEGYTDNTGNAEKNMQLSQARADAVKARLMGKNGISPDRVSTKGFGDANPVGDNGTAEGRAQNRRIEINIVK